FVQSILGRMARSRVVAGSATLTPPAPNVRVVPVVLPIWAVAEGLTTLTPIQVASAPMLLVQLAAVETVLSQTAISLAPGKTPPTHRAVLFRVPEALARLISAASIVSAKKVAIAEIPRQGRTRRSFALITNWLGCRFGTFL